MSSKVRIIFKSGYAQEFECEQLTVESCDNVVTKLSWDELAPRPIYICLKDIAAVLKLSE